LLEQQENLVEGGTLGIKIILY